MKCKMRSEEKFVRGPSTALSVGQLFREAIHGPLPFRLGIHAGVGEAK